MSRHNYFRCDRCGAKFEDPMTTRLKLVSDLTIEEMKLGLLVPREKRIDLCRECMDTFINWLKFDDIDVTLE